MRKPVYLYVNNKCTDETVHPHSLIRDFVIICLDTVITVVSIF